MSDSESKSYFGRLMYSVRDLRSKVMFRAMEQYCRGHILDVGGWDFYLTARRRGVRCESWTTLEIDPTRTLKLDDPKFRTVHGNGCAMQFPDSSFDVVLNIQVLEHVFDPLQMLREMERVLKPSGIGIFLIPQTSNLHLIPHHYYNFTIFWIREAMRQSKLEIVELEALGGAWSTIASRMVYFLLQAFRTPTLTYGEKRNWFFYLMLPVMILYVLINVPICMFFSLGDMSEEANNHLVVVRKPGEISLIAEGRR